MQSQLPFQYHFLDERLSKEYDKDKRQIKLIRIFSIISILVSCLGLFGLASYSAARKTKEIGIRKVQGATMKQIVYLLQKEILFITLIALFVAIPVTILVFHFWLREFAYQVSINCILVIVVLIASLLFKKIPVSLP